MEAHEAAATIGELVFWTGLVLGLPLLAVVGAVRLYDGGWVPAEIVVIDDADPPEARWSSGGSVHARPLTPWEAHRLGEGTVHAAYTGRNDPALMRLDPFRTAMRALLVVALVLLGSAGLGLLVSLLPFVVG